MRATSKAGDCRAMLLGPARSCGSPLIMMMESAHFGYYKHLPLFRGHNGTRLWTIHRQGQMRSPPMIIGKIADKDALEMLRVEDHHMVETFATNAANEALDVGVLPWTVGCAHDFVDPHVLVVYLQPAGNSSCPKTR